MLFLLFSSVQRQSGLCLLIGRSSASLDGLKHVGRLLLIIRLRVVKVDYVQAVVPDCLLFVTCCVLQYEHGILCAPLSLSEVGEIIAR